MDTRDVQSIMAPVLRDLKDDVIYETARRFRELGDKIAKAWDGIQALEARLDKLERTDQ